MTVDPLELCDAASDFGKSLSRGGAGDLDVEAPSDDFTEEEVYRAGWRAPRKPRVSTA